MESWPGVFAPICAKRYTAFVARLTVEIIPDLEEGGFTARVPAIPAYGEGETEAEAIADIKEELQGYIEAFGVEAAISRCTGVDC